MEFQSLDPLMHTPLRLAVMNILVSMPEAEFGFIREKTNASAGNLSVQINKLKLAGYLEVVKHFRSNYPLTTCKITEKGAVAFHQYVQAIHSYINPEKN